MLETLASPPFESELKRAAAQKAAMVSKQQIQTELGTSVAPRQRPKGNVSSQNLPLVLPSSPSPKNAIASPSSVQIDPNSEGGDRSNSISQDTTPVSPYAVHNTPTKSNKSDLFEAPFRANFTDSQSTTSIGSKNDIQSPTSPLHHSLLNTPKTLAAGHRRNMSDTSAFNKYSSNFHHTYFVIQMFKFVLYMTFSFSEHLQTKQANSWHHLNPPTKVA